MKNSKILVKLIGFNLVMLLFACGKEDSTTEGISAQSQKLVQISSNENGNKWNRFQIEYNQVGDIDNTLNENNRIFFYYDKNNRLNNFAFDFWDGKKFYDVIYGDNEIDFKFCNSVCSISKKYIFNTEGYPIKCNDGNWNTENYVWENGNLVGIKSQNIDLVIEYDDKINAFATINNIPFKNPQYLVNDLLFDKTNIINYSKNNPKRITSRYLGNEYTKTFSYQYNNANLPTEVKREVNQKYPNDYYNAVIYYYEYK